MLTKYLVIFLNVAYLIQAIPQQYSSAFTLMAHNKTKETMSSSGNKSVDIFPNLKTYIDLKIEAIEKTTNVPDKRVKELETTTWPLKLNNKLQRANTAAPECTVNLSNVTPKMYSSDLKYKVETIEDSTTTEQPAFSEDEFEENYCNLNIDTEPKLQPLTLTTTLSWPIFKRNKAGLRFIRIYKDKKLIFVCPKQIKNFHVNHITATCEGGSKVRINGILFEYSDIKCTEEVTHVVEKTGQPCLQGAVTTERVKIFIKLFDSKTVKLYDICMDTTYNNPIYTIHFVDYDIINVENNEETKTMWSDASQLKMDSDEPYNCTVQTNYISKRLHRNFHKEDRCCFAKRQLVSHKDLSPGVPQRAAFNNMNFAPQWSTCNSQNWDEVERRLRSLKNLSFLPYLFWTGVKYDQKREIVFLGGNYTQHTPTHFWKVVQEPLRGKSLAIIQVNVPDVTEDTIRSHILCTDICNSTGWMQNADWTDISRGYTYCCSINEFEAAFGFHNVFDKDSTKVLSSLM